MADGFVAPATVRANARRGLELRREFGRGGTEVGIARARDISNGSALSLSTIKRMNSFFARHEVDKKGENWGNASNPSNGYIAWLLWGGDAGWSWAKKIIRQEENKEKSTMSNLTTSYFSIEKADRNPDGTMTVYGKATDSSIDIDQQICDADWLERAMPHWFKSGGNIREQHSNIAAGVATDYEAKSDGHYISALVVDPVSVKKVDAGVLKGFSVGIKNPRVVRDTKAANGRIVDGQIVEISLVDRPANPNCTLVLAKSVSGEETVVQVEELHENIENENLIESDNNSEKESDTMEKSTITVPKSIVGDLVKFDKAQFEAARDALANLISIEGQEIKEGGNELMSISHLLEAVAHLQAWYEGEEAEGEVEEEADIELAAKKESDASDDAEADDEEEDDDAADDTEAPKKKTMKAKKSKKDSDAEADAEAKKEADADAEADDDMKKCPTCGMKKKMCKCDLGMKSDAAEDMTPTYETQANLTGSRIVPPTETPKSAQPTEDSAEQAEKLDHLVEEVVEQVTKSLKSEIAQILSAKEAAESEVMALRSELATAKSLALGGGPKRTTKPIDAEASDDLLIKASVYEAKAKATTDQELAKGYKQLAKEFLAKHAEVTGK